MSPSIIIVAEHLDGKILPVTFELASFARAVQRYKPAAVKSLILGEGVAEMAQELSRITGQDVTAIEIPGLVSYNASVYKTILGELAKELGSICICVAHTSRGLDFASGLAIKIGAACITGVEGITWDGHQIRLTRTIYNGKISAEVAPETEPYIITLQPGMFESHVSDENLPGNVEVRTMPCPPRMSRCLGIRRVQTEDAGLAQAKVIVSAGRGIGKKENLELINRLADLFPRSAVGGSRLVCDMEWLEYKRQVGITGTAVAPDLYIACGVSGAFQHVAGMRDSGFIVAINTDPNAAIFNVSDICIVEDLTTFIPAFIKARENEKYKT